MRRGHIDLSDAFARVLAKHRAAKKLSREALSQKAGVHQTYIGLVERGLRTPGLDTADSIAEALELPLSQLVAEAEKIRKRDKRKSQTSARAAATED